MKGHLFILSGPSGVGKNAVEQKLKALVPDLKRLITTTTREPRPQEKNGIHYNFVTMEHFKEMVENGAFYEWAVVHDHMYGSKKADVETALAEGKQILMIVDVQGAISIKQKFSEAILIFIAPESIEQLQKHISKRSGMSESELELRLENAKKETAMRDYYDYVVTNREGELESTAKEIAGIVGKIMSE